MRNALLPDVPLHRSSIGNEALPIRRLHFVSVKYVTVPSNMVAVSVAALAMDFGAEDESDTTGSHAGGRTPNTRP